MLLLGFDVLIIISTYFIYKELLKNDYNVEKIVVKAPPKYEDINENNENNPPDYNII